MAKVILALVGLVIVWTSLAALGKDVTLGILLYSLGYAYGRIVGGVK